MSNEEKLIIAYHETGHALVGWALPNADPILTQIWQTVFGPVTGCGMNPARDLGPRLPSRIAVAGGARARPHLVRREVQPVVVAVAGEVEPVPLDRVRQEARALVGGGGVVEGLEESLEAVAAQVGHEAL